MYHIFYFLILFCAVTRSAASQEVYLEKHFFKPSEEHSRFQEFTSTEAIKSLWISKTASGGYVGHRIHLTDKDEVDKARAQYRSEQWLIAVPLLLNGGLIAQSIHMFRRAQFSSDQCVLLRIMGGAGLVGMFAAAVAYVVHQKPPCYCPAHCTIQTNIMQLGKPSSWPGAFPYLYIPSEPCYQLSNDELARLLHEDEAINLAVSHEMGPYCDRTCKQAGSGLNCFVKVKDGYTFEEVVKKLFKPAF